MSWQSRCACFFASDAQCRAVAPVQEYALLTCHPMLAAPGECRRLGLPLLEAAAAAAALLHALSGMPDVAAATGGDPQAVSRMARPLGYLVFAMNLAVSVATACHQSAVAAAAERVLGGALKLLAVRRKLCASVCTLWVSAHGCIAGCCCPMQYSLQRQLHVVWLLADGYCAGSSGEAHASSFCPPPHPAVHALRVAQALRPLVCGQWRVSSQRASQPSQPALVSPIGNPMQDDSGSVRVGLLCSPSPPLPAVSPQSATLKVCLFRHLVQADRLRACGQRGAACLPGARQGASGSWQRCRGEP